MDGQDIHGRATRAIRALREPDAALTRVPNTIRQSIADVIEELIQTPPPPEAKEGAAPSPETGWMKPVAWRVPAKNGPVLFTTRQQAQSHADMWGYVVEPLFSAAPAAPSPDLAALEELAERWEHGGASHVLVGSADRARYAAAIRSILKAQPNAGPADGGKGGQ